MSVLRAAALVPAAVIAVGLLAWSAAAVWIDGPSSRAVAGAMVIGLVAGAGVIAVRVRPAGRALMAILVPFGIVLVWWLSIAPRNDRDWQPDVARPATMAVDGDRLTVHNYRDFEYRGETDFTPRWETRTFDLADVRGVDLFFSFWGPTLIAHTIASWEFADGRHLAISIETRKEVGESYSALRGFFRQYELYYVVADERDVIGLRAAHRGEQVFLYRIGMPPEKARALLISYARRVDGLAEQPDWYNAFTHNCTTTIRLHVEDIGTRNPWNWRLLVNGRGDELLYMRHFVNTTMPHDELRRRSDVTERARATAGDPAFSRRIREGLPTRPAA